jgi:TatD DNase family protein
MSYPLIDIGANLTHDSFDEDRSEMMQRAIDAGVTRIIVTGASDEGNVAATALAAANPGHLYATAGVHPHHASDYGPSSDELIRSLAAKGAIVAVGECGLDYFRNFSPRDAQLKAFQSQLQIAADTGLPVFLHQRDAHDDFVELLEPMLPKISRALDGPLDRNYRLDLRRATWRTSARYRFHNSRRQASHRDGCALPHASDAPP